MKQGFIWSDSSHSAAIYGAHLRTIWSLSAKGDKTMWEHEKPREDNIKYGHPSKSLPNPFMKAHTWNHISQKAPETGLQNTPSIPTGQKYLHLQVSGWQAKWPICLSDIHSGQKTTKLLGPQANLSPVGRCRGVLDGLGGGHPQSALRQTQATLTHTSQETPGVLPSPEPAPAGDTIYIQSPTEHWSS